MFYCEDCATVIPDHMLAKDSSGWYICPACTSSNIKPTDHYTIEEDDVPEAKIGQDPNTTPSKWAIEAKKRIANRYKLEGMVDTGERVEHLTGATREPHANKGRFDLIPPEMMFRLAKWYELGGQKYEDRNWEKGLPVSNCINSLLRHAFKYLAGIDDEDHLAAVIWNAAAIMHYEKNNPDMQDLPTRKP